MAIEQNIAVDQGGMWEPQATALALELRLESRLAETATRLAAADTGSPWLLCYLAMDRRIGQGDYAAALKLAQAAIARFERRGDREGRARALAEVALARYHLGQYATALAEIGSGPLPAQPCCAAALALAAYVNYVGLNTLPEAVRAAVQGLKALEYERRAPRRAAWRIVLQRNLAAAYHYQGELAVARAAVEDAVALAAAYVSNSYLHDWACYEHGLLEQRAGRLDHALGILRGARERVEHSAAHAPIRRWLLAAEGHTLRDMGCLEEADTCYRLGGWGEGDDGPLMLWLLQGRHTEASCAAEARLAAAYASQASFEVTNLQVFLCLLELESGATPVIRTTLSSAVEQYAALGFLYHHASALFHLAAVEYALGAEAAGDRALAEALQFGAARGYHNFAWWYPARMRILLHRAVAAGIEAGYSALLLRERGLAMEMDTTAAVDAPARLATTPVAPAASLVLRCLGRFEVCLDGARLPRERWQGHPAGAIRMQRLLLYLARQRRPQPIEAIARYVWPDSWETIDVAHNVHLTLAGLRRVFEPGLTQGSASRFVLTTPQGYQLLPSLNVTVDLEQFHDQVRRARNAEAAGDSEAAGVAFAQAEQLYTGDFALAKPDLDEVEHERRLLLEVLCRLATNDLRNGALDSCVARARRALREDRWDTTAPVLLIAAYLAQGQRRAARRQYERFIQEHGAPSPEIARLARENRL